MALEDICVIAVDFGTSNTVVATNRDTYLHDELSGKQTIPSAISILPNDGGKRYGQASRDSDDTCAKHFLEFKRYVTSHTKDDIMEHAFREWWKYIRNRTNATHVVATVPVSWEPEQKQKYRDLISTSGMQVISLYDEPVAAMAYHYGANAVLSKDVVVYDMGAGTLDISCICHETGYIKTAGNSDFGGTNLIMALYEKVIDTYPHLREWLGQRSIRKKRLFLECEEHIRRGCDIEIWFPHDDTTFKISYYKLLQYIKYRFEDIMTAPLLSVCDKNKEYDLIFVGGPCQSTWVRDIIRRCFKWRVVTETDMMTSVCGGAWILWNDEMMSKKKKDDNMPALWKPTLHDNIGIMSKDGLFVPLIYAGAGLPAYGESTFTTYEDDVNEVNIDVYRGKHFLCDGNTFLFTKVCSIPKESKGIVKIGVNMSVDEYENVEVMACYREYGNAE